MLLFEIDLYDEYYKHKTHHENNLTGRDFTLSENVHTGYGCKVKQLNLFGSATKGSRAKAIEIFNKLVYRLDTSSLDELGIKFDLKPEFQGTRVLSETFVDGDDYRHLYADKKMSFEPIDNEWLGIDFVKTVYILVKQGVSSFYIKSISREIEMFSNDGSPERAYFVKQITDDETSDLDITLAISAVEDILSIEDIDVKMACVD
jgi:hypothetical protein